MNTNFKSLLDQVLNNVETIHENAEKTMDDRKEKHNLDDNSKYNSISITEKRKKVIQEIPLKTILHEEINYKDKSDIVNIIKDRKSIRDYSEKKIKLWEFLELLRYTFGYRGFESGIYGFKEFPVSFIPSAGGLSCVSHYVLVRNVENLKRGLYRYNRTLDSLELLSEGNYYYKMPEFLYETGFAQNSSFTILLYVDLEKIVWKYGERGYRFAHLDAGVAAQNLHLLAKKYNIGSCMIAGYQDKKVRKTFNLEKNEVPMLVMSFGYIKQKGS